METVIREHPGVLDVAVTGFADKEAGDLPVACVVPRFGYNVTAQEIKDLVKSKTQHTALSAITSRLCARCEVLLTV